MRTMSQNFDNGLGIPIIYYSYIQVLEYSSILSP